MTLESILSDNSEVTFYDTISCRYFSASLRLVLKLLSIYYLKLNDFYTIVGLSKVGGYDDKIVRLKCECRLDKLPGENMDRVLYMLSEYN